MRGGPVGVRVSLLVVLAGMQVALGTLPARRSRVAADKASVQQPSPLPLAIHMNREAAIQFPLPSPVMVQTNVKCDSAGDIYAVWTDSPEVKSTHLVPLRRVALGSIQVLEYKIPPVRGYPYEVRRSFSVEGDGKPQVLFWAFHTDPSTGGRADYFIDKFKYDGTLDSQVKLSGPIAKYFVPYVFATFSDGRFLVLGMISDGNYSQRSPYAGVFDSSGKFLKQVPLSVSTNSTFPNVDWHGSPEGLVRAKQFLAVDEGTMFTDPNGDIYVVLAGTPAHIFVVSPNGDVQKEVRVNPPQKGLIAVGTGGIGPGFIYVRFDRIVMPDNPLLLA